MKASKEEPWPLRCTGMKHGCTGGAFADLRPYLRGRGKRLHPQQDGNAQSNVQIMPMPMPMPMSILMSCHVLCARVCCARVMEDSRRRTSRFEGRFEQRRVRTSD